MNFSKVILVTIIKNLKIGESLLILINSTYIRKINL